MEPMWEGRSRAFFWEPYYSPANLSETNFYVALHSIRGQTILVLF